MDTNDDLPCFGITHFSGTHVVEYIQGVLRAGERVIHRIFINVFNIFRYGLKIMQAGLLNMSTPNMMGTPNKTKHERYLLYRWLLFLFRRCHFFAGHIGIFFVFYISRHLYGGNLFWSSARKEFRIMRQADQNYIIMEPTGRGSQQRR